MSNQPDEGADDADVYVHGYTAIYFYKEWFIRISKTL